MEDWRNLFSDRVYAALEKDDDEARALLRALSEEVDRTSHELSESEAIYLKVFALSHMPSIDEREALHVRDLVHRIEPDSYFLWAGLFQSVLALYYAGIHGTCLEEIARMGMPPDLDDAHMWRWLKVLEIALACRLYLAPGLVRPEDVRDFFSQLFGLMAPEDAAVPEELLSAFTEIAGRTMSEELRRKTKESFEVFRSQVALLDLGSLFSEDLDAIGAALGGES